MKKYFQFDSISSNHTSLAKLLDFKVFSKIASKASRCLSQITLSLMQNLYYYCHLNCLKDVSVSYEIKNMYGTQGLEIRVYTYDC